MFRQVLVAALLIVGLLTSQPVLAGNGESMLTWVPKDTMVLVSLDVEQLRDSHVFDDLMTAAKLNPRGKLVLDSLRLAGAFDLEEDVETLILLLPTDAPSSRDFLIVAEGHFKEDKLVKLIADSGAELTEHQVAGKTMHVINEDRGLLFTGNVALLGSVEMVERAFGEDVRKNDELLTVINSIDKDQDIWMVLQPVDAIRDPTGGKLDEALKSIAGTFEFEDGMEMELTSQFRSDQDAKDLVALFEARRSETLEDTAMQLLGLTVAFEKMKATREGAEVTVSLDLTREEFDRIVATLKEFL